MYCDIYYTVFIRNKKNQKIPGKIDENIYDEIDNNAVVSVMIKCIRLNHYKLKNNGKNVNTSL